VIQHSQDLDPKRYIEHTLLKNSASEEEVLQEINVALETKSLGLCLFPAWLKVATETMKAKPQQPILVSVFSFPHGLDSTRSKINQAEELLALGAQELDFVQNLSLVKSKCWKKLEEEFLEIRKNIAPETPLKVILETALLSEEEIYQSALLAHNAGIDFIKTSTGFSSRGASLKDVEIIQKIPNVRIKASGGIRSYSEIKKYIEAGVERVGCSATLEIMKGYNK